MIDFSSVRSLTIPEGEVAMVSSGSEVLWQKAAEPHTREIYGVEWDYSQSSSVLTRLESAASFANPTPAASLDGTGSSPFDGIMPWAGMKRYNIIDDDIAYSEDDEGFDMTAYDTVVYIPKFWYKAEKDEEAHKWRWYISPEEQEGFALHPCSDRYIGRYHTSSEYTSVSGISPLGSITRSTGRTKSHAKGEYWWQMDFATWCGLELLYLVEFANWDSQTVLGTGNDSGSKTNTGGTDDAVYHTVKRSKASNQYRWIENPYSNMRTFCDGFVASSRAVYAGLDNSGFSDTKTNLTDSGITLPISNYTSGYGYSDEFPWAFIPDTAQNVYERVRDYVFSNTGDCGLYVGGNYVANAGAGLFYVGAGDGVSVSSPSIGSRLVYIPKSKYKTEVEYLESTGTQYINIGEVFKNTDECYADAAIFETETDKFFVAPASWNNNNNRFSMGGIHEGFWTCGYGSKSTGSTRYTPNRAIDQNKHSFSYKNKVFTIDDLGLTMNGTSISWGGDTRELRLFYGYNSPSRCRIYSYRQIRDGELIKDLIPVLDWNDRPCMYDKVTDTLFYNAGTGEFLYA